MNGMVGSRLLLILNGPKFDAERTTNRSVGYFFKRNLESSTDHDYKLPTDELVGRN